MDGTVTSDLNDQGTGSVGFDLFSTPKGCVVDTNQGHFTVEGDPNFRYMATWNLDEWEPVGVITMSFTGGFAWDGQGSSGDCVVTFAYDIDYESPADSSYTGSICGHDITD